MPISRSQMPRQMYGLGSLVKSIGKTVKKVVKSPIGKAAILGLGVYGLGGGFGAGFKFGNLPGASLFSGGGAGLGSMFSKAKNLYSGLSGAQKLMGAGSLGLAALAGAPEEVQETSKRDVSSLRQYLASYYKNLGYSDNQIAENVARDTSEYTSGQGGYAMGGRVNYQDGTPKKGLDSISFKDMEKFIIKMPHKIKYDEDGNRIEREIPRTKGPAKFDPDRKIPRLLLRNKSANGGRIMRAYGSDELVEQASGIEGLDININPKGVKELDLRDSGGFIPPVGVKEKADDIPAMLSNNEFVFTADAVRAAGGGSVNKGAQIMYDTMKKLENGGTV